MKIQKFKNSARMINAMALGVLFMSVPVIGFASGADYPPRGDFAKGAQTWADNCGRCHNIRAANELRDDQWISTAFHMRMRAGLTGQETRDVLTFLQGSNTSVKVSTTPSSSASVSTLSGKEVYGQTCVACHGANGAGNFPGVPNLTKKSGPLSKKDDALIKNIMGGFQSPGSPMAMPAKGGNPDLNKKDIEKTVEYMRKQFVK